MQCFLYCMYMYTVLVVIVLSLLHYIHPFQVFDFYCGVFIHSLQVFEVHCFDQVYYNII